MQIAHFANISWLDLYSRQLKIYYYEYIIYTDPPTDIANCETRSSVNNCKKVSFHYSITYGHIFRELFQTPYFHI